MTEDLTPKELAEITGKKRAALQAAVLARQGVPFVFLGRTIKVARAVAQAHALLPERQRPPGIDFNAVR